MGRTLTVVVGLGLGLGWVSSASALCEPENELTDLVAKHKSAPGSKDSEALNQARTELDQAIATLPKELTPECRRDRQAALKKAAELKAKIAKAEIALGNAHLAFALDFSEDAQEGDATVYLNGDQLSPTSEPKVLKGDTYEVRVQLESAVRRTFDVTVTLGSAQLKMNRREGSSLIYQVKLPPGQQSLSVLITGTRIPEAQVLELNIKPEDKKGRINVKIGEKLVPAGNAPIVLDGNAEEHVLLLEHPSRETKDGWFRLKLKRDHEPQQPTSKDSKQTVYKFKAVEGKTTKMDLMWKDGPKVHPWRENLIYAGLGIAAVGVAGAIVFGLEAIELEDEWLETYEDNDCGTPEGCSEDVQEQVLETWEEADSCYTWTNVGLITAGTGLVLAGVSFFFLESGEDPPDDMVRNDRSDSLHAHRRSRDGLVDVKLQPEVGSSVLGARFSASW